MPGSSIKTVAIIVAHPDDETLWAGGTILSNPYWECFIISICRGSDKERAPRFSNALQLLHATGIMGDLDDGPEQMSLEEQIVEQTILELLPKKHFDLVISHNPSGEYTRHARHEEVSKAVITLWHKGKIAASELWTFAYEDSHKACYPKSVESASIYQPLPKRIWLKKYSIITETYGFEPSSWEAKTTPKAESFWQFSDSHAAIIWLNNKGIKG